MEEKGLTSAEARQRSESGQSNRMPKNSDGGVSAIVRRNVLTLFNFLNLALAVLLLLVGSYRNMLFMMVVLCNAVIGLVQELRAKRTHDRLLLLAEGKIRALRDGVETPLSPRELVLDDVIRLRRGEQAPADALVLSGEAEVNESLLTGESEPIPKRMGDTLLSGCYVTEGDVTARLTAVGANSFAGKLQMNARCVKRSRSELMEQMNKLIRIVSIAIVPIGAALFCKQYFGLHVDMTSAVTKTVAGVIGMIPEGLILLTSVALSVGVIRLGKRRALVNELYGIESLARTDVICLDKTGTLTCGKMRLNELRPVGDGTSEWLDAAMCAMTAAFPNDESATQDALRDAFAPEKAKEQALETVAFSSDRKWSAARFDTLGTLVLGAPEKTLPRGETLELAQAFAAQGLRVLAILRTDAPLNGRELPERLRPMGLLMIGDALRDSAKATLRYFEEQGVALKVISGDSALTVSRIAQEAGLDGAERAVDCSALQAPVDYDRLAKEYAVFGRVSPDDKRELVQALKRQGHSVAMIGDGVNDIPALKAADCSIAMAGGSDAACRVAQVTLLDADFSVMPHIVLEGRRVINNITRAASLFLVKNIFSLLLSALLLALPYVYPFSPIQLTLISSLTIGAPSFVLALQPNKERVRGDFLRNVFRRALPGGVTIAVGCVAVLVVGSRLGLGEPVLSTLCTAVAAVGGLSVLFATCLPFDRIRLALFVLMSAAMIAAMELMPNLFYLVKPTGAAAWVLGCSIVATPLLLWGLMALLRPKRAVKTAEVTE